MTADAVSQLHDGRQRFRPIEGRCAALIEARSNVGRIVFATTTIFGSMSAAIDQAGIDPDPSPTGTLSIPVASLRSGNSLYDAELQNRVHSRHHPLAILEFGTARRIGNSDHYSVTGALNFHGKSRALAGTLEIRVQADGNLHIAGEQVIDIRDFDIATPSILMLRIYPDVRVHLQIDAEPGDGL